LIEITQALVRIPSETPPSDTGEVARAVAELLSGIDGAKTSIHTSEVPIDNLVSSVRATRPGKRLVLNGHLDTYPAGDAAKWSDDPYSGRLLDGRLYGRGSADMKGGVACLLTAFRTLAAMRDAWVGEVSLVLAGDEESMGTLGSQFLLDNVAEARGDAMLNADVGSPKVPRIGEKGMIWIDVFASGHSAHGAHVHRGANAIDALRRAMDALETLSGYTVPAPKEVERTIAQAKPFSELLGGAGEADVLRRITVNFGRIDGGQSPNLVPDGATLHADIRLPMGVSVSEVEAQIHRLLEPIDRVRYSVTRRYEPTWTSPLEPIVASTLAACRSVFGGDPLPNMRVGASDARLYRAAGIPTVVCGLTPHNLGAPDEYVDVNELVDVAKIHTLGALDFLRPE
ncbi:MAG: M20/M25/M40 family metallo-hydrolase, partial [Pirellulales bacterium]|nr:M20/M25/M40 family metallo-hydrolase [Pirellulales bacterium]